MKKILALALVLAMMLTMFSFVTSATDATPEGTALTQESDFDTLVADGKYYLANDIMMSGTATHVIPQGVTINGNGFVIYTEGELKAPLFALQNYTETVVVIDEETGEPVQVEQPVLDGEGNPVLDEGGNPVTELVNKTKEVSVDYTNATVFQNLKLGAKGKLITLSKTDVYHDSYAMTAPVFEENNSGIVVVFDNVDMLFYRPQVADDAVGYVNTLFWNMKGTQLYVDCDLTLSITSAKGALGGFALNMAGDITMSNCTVAGAVSTSKDAGCFAKEVSSGTVTISDCVNNATLTSAGIAGGFFSSVRGNLFVYDCVNNANLDLGAHAGSLFGNSQKEFTLYVDGFENNGTVKGTAHLGGIMGAIWNKKVDGFMNTIKNVTNNGAVNPTGTGGYTGGIIGDNGKTPMILENVVNNGAVFGATRHIGGFIGRNAQDNGTSDFLNDVLLFRNCVNNGDVYKTGNNGNEAAGFVAIQAGSTSSHVLRMVFENCVNNGNIGNATYVDSSRTTAGFIGCTDFINVHPEASMSFINCVNNGNMAGGSLGSGGFVGYSQDSMYFENCVNTGNVTGHVSGTAGFCGLTSWRANASNILPDYKDRLEEMGVKTGAGVKAYNCINTGTITSTAAVPTAGFFGKINSAVTVVIDNCANYGNVSGGNDGAGILANHAGSLTVTRCVNYGDISGSQIVGGIIGWKNAGDAYVANCVNYGDVKGCHGVGGIMGEIVVGTIENCLNAGNIGPFSGNAEGIGGIVGIYRTVTNEINIINCANIGTVTGTTKANVTYGCFTEGFGQIIGRVGGGSNGNDPYIADSGLVEGVFTFDDGDAIVPVIKLTGVIAAGAAQVNPDANLAPSEVVLGYKAGTSTPEYTITDTDALPVVRNNGLYGDNVQIAADSTVSLITDAEAAVAALEAAFPTLNFKVVDGKVVVDTATTIRGYQASKDGKAIRFAATLDSADAETAGFVYTLTYNGQALVTDAKVEALNLMYAVKGSNGLSTELAAVHGGQLFNTITFKGVPATGTLVITVQATVDGVATGAVATVTIVDGVIA